MAFAKPYKLTKSAPIAWHPDSRIEAKMDEILAKIDAILSETLFTPEGVLRESIGTKV